MSATASNQPACRALCVAPALVDRFWPHVSAVIARAIARGNVSRFADLERAVLSGAALLWLAVDRDRIVAAAVTQLAATDTEKHCILVACAGARMRRWLSLIETIEAYARAEGCARVRIVGRTGWARMLAGYRTSRVILDRRL